MIKVRQLHPRRNVVGAFLLPDTWTNNPDGLWTDPGADPNLTTDSGTDMDPDLWRENDSDTEAETQQKPLRYEDYLRMYLDGDTDFSALKKESVILQEAVPKSKEQIKSELAPKIRTPGMTSGRAVIAAQEMYSEAEKIFGPDADIAMEAYQPGQDPRKFLDGFRNAYLSGKMGSRAALENSTAAAYLSDSQRELAFAMGAQAAGIGSDYGDMRTIKGALQYLRETVQGKKSGGGQEALPPPLDMFPENDIMDKTRNRQKRHFWNIMNRQKGIPQDYLRMLTERFDRGTDLGKKVFLKYVSSDSVADFAENGNNHLSKRDRRIHLNAQKDMNDPRGHGTRFFHEHGHFIDLFAVGGEWKKRVSTRNNTFSKLIRSDFEMLCRKLIQQGAQGQKNAYEMLSEKIKGHNMHAISDIIGGLTKNECGGNYKHDNAYWEKPGSLARETFAHMFEALFDDKKYALLQEYFPNAFDEFIRMLEEIL